MADAPRPGSEIRAQLIAHLAEAAGRGAARVVVTFAGGHWPRQAELLAQATALLT